MIRLRKGRGCLILQVRIGASVYHWHIGGECGLLHYAWTCDLSRSTGYCSDCRPMASRLGLEPMP